MRMKSAPRSGPEAARTISRQATYTSPSGPIATRGDATRPAAAVELKVTDGLQWAPPSVERENSTESSAVVCRTYATYTSPDIESAATQGRSTSRSTCGSTGRLRTSTGRVQVIEAPLNV